MAVKKKIISNQWYEPRGKPRPPIPQQAAGNLPGEIKTSEIYVLFVKGNMNLQIWKWAPRN
jgi:hypothetical protein